MAVWLPLPLLPSLPGTHKGAKVAKRSSGNAYKPKKPFKTIEGVGTELWMRLSRNAVYVLDRFYAKFNGYNRDDLSLTYPEMKNKMSGRLFTISLWELIGFGFIDIVRQGRLERECSIYRLSNQWRKLENEPKILDKIELHLEKVEKLMREEGGIEKRMRINKLRNSILRLLETRKA